MHHQSSRRRRQRKGTPIRFPSAHDVSNLEEEGSLEHPRQQEAAADEIQQPVKQADHNSDSSGTDPDVFNEVVAAAMSELENHDFDDIRFFSQLFDVGKELTCAICLGIIKNSRACKRCLHRFCKECIDKAMRLGRKKECPICRKHCDSRRSFRDDPDFDTLVTSIYPDIEKYEQEEVNLTEEERTRNEQIQAYIAQICRQQSEDLIPAQKTRKDTASSSISRA